MTVLEFPPKESFNNQVNLESLCGIGDFVPFILDLHRAFMQFPKVNKDLLIFAPFISLIPLFLFTLALSLPARSIKLYFPYFILLFVVLFSLYETIICKIA